MGGKFIRANLMLGWLKRNHDCSIVHVLRHPAAVVESKMRLGGADWEPWRLLDSYLTDERLVRSFLSDYEKALAMAKRSNIAAHTAIWCIENLPALRDAAAWGVCTVFYEDLLNDTAGEWKRVVEALRISEMPDPNDLRVPSQQVSPAKRGPRFDPLSATDWERALGSGSIREIDGILQAFDVDVYSVHERGPLHRKKAVEARRKVV